MLTHSRLVAAAFLDHAGNVSSIRDVCASAFRPRCCHPAWVRPQTREEITSKWPQMCMMWSTNEKTKQFYKRIQGSVCNFGFWQILGSQSTQKYHAIRILSLNFSPCRSAWSKQIQIVVCGAYWLAKLFACAVSCIDRLSSPIPPALCYPPCLPLSSPLLLLPLFSCHWCLWR